MIPWALITEFWLATGKSQIPRTWRDNIWFNCRGSGRSSCCRTHGACCCCELVILLVSSDSTGETSLTGWHLTIGLRATSGFCRGLPWCRKFVRSFADTSNWGGDVHHHPKHFFTLELHSEHSGFDQSRWRARVRMGLLQKSLEGILNWKHWCCEAKKLKKMCWRGEGALYVEWKRSIWGVGLPTPARCAIHWYLKILGLLLLSGGELSTDLKTPEAELSIDIWQANLLCKNCDLTTWSYGRWGDFIWNHESHGWETSLLTRSCTWNLVVQ